MTLVSMSLCHLLVDGIEAIITVHLLCCSRWYLLSLAQKRFSNVLHTFFFPALYETVLKKLYSDGNKLLFSEHLKKFLFHTECWEQTLTFSAQGVM